MSLEGKIKDIVNKNGSSIIVIKGFNDFELPKDQKYFSFSVQFYDDVIIESLRQQVVEDIIKNREFVDSYLWMTIEEYKLFEEYYDINNMPIALIENNLYDKQFPYKNTVSDINLIYKNLYLQEDEDLDVNMQNMHNNISFFYGKFDYSKESKNYYVTYPEIYKNIEIYKYYEEEPYNIELSDEYPVDELFQIELSDDEIPFLDLINNIEENKKILFVLSGEIEELPNNYLARLNILSKISNYEFYFTTLSVRRNIIANESEYLKILKEVYGYKNFRNIKFYKNIESRSKEIIEISQMQIIDDIVIQAEKALMEEPFRDIYITASTGSGKSLMFQVPALYLAKKYNDSKPLVLVISPLIGLMNDQVDSMKKKGINNSDTINGDTPPYEKQQIIEKIQNGETDVLYLSPETLQARSDIKMLIGDRKIGVVIIDEAHIVTTWGKSFRADYWYLGIYLAKLRKEYRFPIVTFTATSIYGGCEDMYLDTRNSLNMISPISYFGNVRRDNIFMDVTDSQKDLDKDGRDYRKTKSTLALRFLKLAFKKNKKTLMYFPTIKLLRDFYSTIRKNNPEIAEKTGKYYGSLPKEEKDEVLREYKNGELLFVLATKAFGMGIDIPDITYVYHYAPTGNVVDYIQEIGRAARDEKLVENGFGKIDFLKKDLNEVKQFYGMSSVKKIEILSVMQKVLDVYKEKGNNRNIVLSSEDFKCIFEQSNMDENSLDNKVKTILLMIEKDFSSPNKLGYSPFVARPRSLFGNDLIFVTPELEEKFINSRLSKFFSEKYNLNGDNYSAIYDVNLSGIWEKYYSTMTFPSFKYSLFNNDSMQNLKHKNIFKNLNFTSGIEVAFAKDIDKIKILSEYKRILQLFETFVDGHRISNTQFTVEQLGRHFMKNLKISDKFEAQAFAQSIINAAFEFSSIKNINFIKEVSNSSARQNYRVHQDGDIFTKFIINAIGVALNPKTNYISSKDNLISFYNRNIGVARQDEVGSKIAALGIGEARKLLTYQLIGGNNPQIYIRMNSIYPLENAINKGVYYENAILSDVRIKHYTSVEMLKYLFTKEQNEKNSKDRIFNYTKWFWENIENYFMGIIPHDVKNKIGKNIDD